MVEDKPLLIKRYASRRLYNTETSDYVTLDDIARVIQAGRDVAIVDLKTGDDLTRQYFLQIIAEHEAKGENVLPLGILTDLIRSYSGPQESVVAHFLAVSFRALRAGETRLPPVGERELRPSVALDEVRAQLAELQDKLARL